MSRGRPSRVPPLLLALLLPTCDPGEAAPPDAAPPTDAAPDAPAPDAAPADAAPEYAPEPFEPTEATRAWCPGDDDAVEARITELLGELSTDEKVALLAGDTALIRDTWNVPGNARLGLPGLHMLDGPRGVSGFGGRRATAFPVAMMRGATWDPALEESVGRAIAVEARAAGADVLLAPTINLLRHPRWGRAQETYSEDTAHMAAFGVAFVRGVQAEGVLASVKHFAVNSIEDTRHRVDVRIDERALREVYLPHFRRAVVEAHAASVMSAYNQVNGRFCDLNHHLLTEILKEEWRFPGFVESDWILGTHGDVESLRAGLDIEMPTGIHFHRLAAAVEEGELTLAEVDRSVRRVLRAQLCYGLDGRSPTFDDAARETPEHLALAREVARRGVVLLRNEPVDGSPVLPLRAGSVAVLGRTAAVENIGDRGSSWVKPSRVVTALAGLVERLGEDAVTHLPGDVLDEGSAATVAAADAAIVVTGLTADDEGEGDIGAGDRKSLSLAAEEVALLRAVVAVQPRTVVVLHGARRSPAPGGTPRSPRCSWRSTQDPRAATPSPTSSWGTTRRPGGCPSACR